jgi:Peptidase family C25
MRPTQNRNNTNPFKHRFVLNRKKKDGKHGQGLVKRVGLSVLLALTAGALIWTISVWAASSQIVGSYPQFTGGFEDEAVGTPATQSSIATGIQTTTWTVQNTSGVATINGTGGRSGPQFITFSGTAARRLQSPTTASQTVVNSTAYTVQFYYKSTAIPANFGVQVNTDGTGTGTTQPVTLVNTAGVWTKVTQSVTTPATALPNPAYGIMTLRWSGVSTNSADFDDVVLYAGAADTTAPNAPTSPTIGTPTTTSLPVSWTAPAGGVDGGGYVVVRGVADPTTAPNVNGVYKTGNTVAAGQTVVFIGAATSFTDTGLSPGTQYFYRIYAVDKAFNYSVAATVSGTTAVAGVGKMVVTLPGETFTSGSGNSGSVTAQSAGTPFNLKLTATLTDGVTTDTSYSGLKTISYSGPGGSPTYTTIVTFASGQAASVPTTLTLAQTTTITASDGTLTGVASSSLLVNPGAINSYVVSATSPQAITIPFITTVTAKDANNNTVTTDSSTVVTMTSASGNMQFDSNGDATFGDNTKTLSSGTFTISTKDNVAETTTITATDTNTKTGTSGSIVVAPPAKYRSRQTGSWNDFNSWQVDPGGGFVNAISGQTPSSTDDTIQIQSPHVITVSANVAVDQVTVDFGGQISVSAGITLTVANGTGTDLAVSGILASAGTITLTGTATFASGSKYQHNFTTSGGTIPTAAWDSNSTVEILGYTSNTSAPSGLGQTFGNFTWNCSAQTGNLSLAGATITATGTFTMTTTNSGSLRLGAGTNGVLAVGNFVQTGGTIDLSSGTGSGSLRVTGTFNQTGGTITESGTGTTNNIEFNGTLGNQSVTVGTVSNTISYIINNAAGVTLGSNLIVNGTLALTSGDLTTTDAFLVTENGTSSGTGDVVGTVRRIDLAGAVQRDFGNPNVEITIVSGDITAMDVTFQKGAPGGFAGAVERYYALEPVTGTVVTDATVKLHYRNSELQANDPATLTLWRGVGSPATWTDQGTAGVTRATGSEPDNWVQKTGVASFSPWTLASAPQAPTAVRLTSFRAVRNNGEVTLQWQSGYEARNLGYNIYREQDGKRVAITPSLVAGSALVAGRQTRLGAGSSYTWYDNVSAEAGPATYWLEDIDLNGTRTLHGPIVPEISYAKPRNRELRADLMSEVSRRTTPNSVQISGWANRSTRQDKPGNSGDAMFADPSDIQHDIAGMAGVKLAVSSGGWYRVSQTELAAAGFTVQDARQLQLYRNGREVAISLSNGNTFTKSDYLEFYGEGLDSPTSDVQTYYLVNGRGNGARINAANGIANPAEPSGPQSFAYTVERRERMIYFSGLRNGDAENFFGQIVSSDPVTANVPVNNLAGASAQLEVVLQGVTNENHLVHVVFNGSDLGTINFANTDHPAGKFAVPAAALREGDNSVELTSMAGASDVSLIDVVRLTYNRNLTATDNALSFSVNSRDTRRISGFTNPNVRVLDISDANSPFELKAAVSPDAGGYAVMVESKQASALSTRTLLAIAGSQSRAVDSVRANVPSAWWAQKAGANYVLLTTADLATALEPLAQMRRSQGMTVAVVDVEDVYDEFSFGKHSPEALRDFLQRAMKSWKRQPRFVLFAGDASYDPRNYLGQGLNDLVPTKLIDTSLTETASDDWLADFNNDGIADLAIGRLPIRTAAEASQLVNKIVSYENSAVDTSRSALLVADSSFEATNNAMKNLLPAGQPVQLINRSATDDATAHSQVINGLNQGPRLANYFGHGSNGIWSGAGLLSSNDAPGLTNSTRLSVFTMMTCFNGYFHDAYNESLSEALLKSHGGAVAVWASTGLTEPTGQNVIGGEFYRLLFGTPQLTLGDAARLAKSFTNDADVRRTWTLFGDPASRLR